MGTTWGAVICPHHSIKLKWLLFYHLWTTLWNVVMHVVCFLYITKMISSKLLSSSLPQLSWAGINNHKLNHHKQEKVISCNFLAIPFLVDSLWLCVIVCDSLQQIMIIPNSCRNEDGSKFELLGFSTIWQTKSTTTHIDMSVDFGNQFFLMLSRIFLHKNT